MLIDDVDITIRGGHGGAGKVSFKGKDPDGGNGGKGGDVYITVISDLKALNQFSRESNISAPNGIPGASNRLYGRKGKDLVLSLPIGTTLTNKVNNDVLELNNLDQKILICKGGLGGSGNIKFKSSKNQSPAYAQSGEPGEYKQFKVVLKFIAEYGFVGLPNAGKSSILNELTNAKAAVGAYSFTTLEANLGAFGQKIIADIPGLIEGASTGRGLGIKFLKHIEKVKMLLHCIAADSKDIVGDYQTINQELQKFKPDLIMKDRLILLTKSDLVDEKTLQNQIKKIAQLKHPIYPISIYDPDSIEKIKEILTLAP